MDEVYNELTNKYGVVKVCSAIYYLFHVPTFVWVYRLPVYHNDDGFEFLGYDIVDSGGISGLSNCGYSKEDLEYCQKIYLPYLNEHGLFSNFYVAWDFVNYTNKRVYEHAPFYVYGLYMDKEA